jgi:hypothetical protein
LVIYTYIIPMLFVTVVLIGLKLNFIRDLTSLFKMTSVTSPHFIVTFHNCVGRFARNGINNIVQEGIQIFGTVYIKRANWNYKN